MLGINEGKGVIVSPQVSPPWWKGVYDEEKDRGIWKIREGP